MRHLVLLFDGGWTTKSPAHSGLELVPFTDPQKYLFTGICQQLSRQGPERMAKEYNLMYPGRDHITVKHKRLFLDRSTFHEL